MEEFGGAAPSAQDKSDVAKFVHLAKSSPLDAANLLASKSEDDFSRFRKQWKIEGLALLAFVCVGYSWRSTGKPQLIEFVKANFAVGEFRFLSLSLNNVFAGLANIVSALLYSKVWN